MFDDARKIKIRLLTPMLGTVPYDKDVYAKYIVEKAKELAKNTGKKPEEIEAEVETVEDVEMKGWTGFHKDEEGVFFIYEYMQKGFLKSAVETLQEGGVIKKIPAYKKWIDRLIQVTPRRIYFSGNPTEADGVLERPLRTMTPKGERVTVTRSDYMDVGRELEFTFGLLPNSKGLTWGVIETCLEYGQHIGYGQWRGSGGYGRFELLSITE